MLLTGGSSRRMGTDKAGLRLRSGGETLAHRIAGLLREVAEVAIEVGPGYSPLPATADPWPGAGPLAAIATGTAALGGAGWIGPALVLATDLPLVGIDVLSWLASHPFPGSVVPLDGAGQPQYLCARYDSATLQLARKLAAEGKRSLRSLVAASGPYLAPAREWAQLGHSDALNDLDTPEDLLALRDLFEPVLPLGVPLNEQGSGAGRISRAPGR